jgi:hypothetical protein
MSRKKREALRAAVERQAAAITPEKAAKMEAAAKVVGLALQLSSAWDAAEKAGVKMDIEVDEVRLGNDQTIKQVMAYIVHVGDD